MKINHINTVEKVLIGILIFLAGFLSAFFVAGFSADYETPLLSGLFLHENNNSGLSPFDFLGEKDIEIYPDKIIIKVSEASISRYEPTGSMSPVLDKGTNGIRIKPKSEKDIHTGDIVSFKKDIYLCPQRF